MFSHNCYPYTQIVQVPSPFTLAQVVAPNQIQPVYQPFIWIPSSPFQFLNPIEESHLPALKTQSTPQKGEKVVSNPRMNKQMPNDQKPVKRVQNPLRNIYTNITNLILNFMITSRKVESLLERVDPTLIGDKLSRFYKYVKDLRNYFSAYFNISKVQKLFSGVTLQKYDRQLHRIFRILVHVILQQKIPKCLLTSNRLSSELRNEHMKARRIMLRILLSTKNKQDQIL